MTDREFMYWLKGVLDPICGGLDYSTVRLIKVKLGQTLKDKVDNTYSPAERALFKKHMDAMFTCTS